MRSGTDIAFISGMINWVKEHKPARVSQAQPEPSILEPEYSRTQSHQTGPDHQ